VKELYFFKTLESDYLVMLCHVQEEQNPQHHFPVDLTTHILESGFVLVLNIQQLFCQTKDRTVGNSRLDILPYILLCGLVDKREIEVCLACQLWYGVVHLKASCFMYLYEMLKVPTPPYPVIVDHVSGNSYIHTLKNLGGVEQVVMIVLVGATFNYATWQDLDKNILCFLYFVAGNL
jgi:hypothetical protein